MAEWEDYDFINYVSNETTLTAEIKCACGKGSCDKNERYLKAYRNFVNQIDDYFEYRDESIEDRKKVHQLLQNLTEQLVNVENE